MRPADASRSCDLGAFASLRLGAGLNEDASRKDAKTQRVNENEIAGEIVDAAYRVHTGLGLLINSGAALSRDGLYRVVNGL